MYYSAISPDHLGELAKTRIQAVIKGPNTPFKRLLTPKRAPGAPWRDKFGARRIASAVAAMVIGGARRHKVR